MRILLVNTGFLPVPPDRGGSIEMHTYYLCNELAKLGNEIHFVTSVNPSAIFQAGVTLYKLPRIPFDFHGNYIKTTLSFGIGGFFAFIKALKAINENKYDIIHVHGHIPGFCLLPLKKRATFIFTAHNPNPWMVKSFSRIKQAFRICAFRMVELRIVKNADCVITVSEQLKKEFIRRFRIPSQKIRVIPNGVDANLFHPTISSSNDILQKYQLPENYVLFVGRLVEQKGVQFLLKAIKGTNIHLVIIGGGPLYFYLKELSRRLEINKQIHFIGSVPLDDLRKIYAKAKFCVIPSVAEGFPLVGLEAMASGLPIIASKIEGVEEMVIDGYNGFLFEKGNVKKLREHILKLFEDEKLVRTMGRRSRKIVENKFSWSVVAQKTFELYKDLARN